MFGTLRFTLRVLRLRRAQRCRPERVHAVQQARWRQLLQEASERSPFYRRRFRGLDLDRCRPTDLATLTKSEMMDHFDDLVTDRRIRRADVEEFVANPLNLGRYYLGRYAVSHTSGSQGQPALVIQEGQNILLGIQAQIARGQATPSLPMPLTALTRLIRPARLAVITQQAGFYPSGSAFAYLAALRLPFVELLRLSVFDPLEATVARLNEFQPNFITGYTSALEVLARAEQAGALCLRQGSRLRGLTNISEPLPPASREFIEEAFGVRISDHYAMAECMALTSGCPCSAGSHVNADLALLEVVDDQDRPVPHGTPGAKVLVTNLYNRAQPLVRYEVGDVVTLSPTPCPCGSPLPLVHAVGGRTKERFWIETAGKVREIPYYLFLAPLHHCTDLAEHQVVQTGRNRFVVRGVRQPGKSISADRLRQLVGQSLRAEGLDDCLDVEFQVVDEIPCDPRSGKTKRAVNLFGPPPDSGEAGRLARDVPVFQRR